MINYKKITKKIEKKYKKPQIIYIHINFIRICFLDTPIHLEKKN